MKRNEVLTLNAALMSQGLKVKHLSATAYVDYLGFKRSMSAYIKEMGEQEGELMNEYGATFYDDSIKCDDSGFWDKLKEIQSIKFTPPKLNFIPLVEFKLWVDELSVAEAEALAEHLLAP